MVNERDRNRWSWNMGSSTWCSMATNPASTAMPPMRQASTKGLVHPMVWPP